MRQCPLLFTTRQSSLRRRKARHFPVAAFLLAGLLPKRCNFQSQQEAQDLLAHAESLAACRRIGKVCYFEALQLANITKTSQQRLFSSACNGSLSPSPRGICLFTHVLLGILQVCIPYECPIQMIPLDRAKMAKSWFSFTFFLLLLQSPPVVQISEALLVGKSEAFLQLACRVRKKKSSVPTSKNCCSMAKVGFMHLQEEEK